MMVPDVRLAKSKGRPSAGRWNTIDQGTLSTAATVAISTGFPTGLTNSDPYTTGHFRAAGHTVPNGTSCYFLTSPFLSYATNTIEVDVTVTAAGGKWALHGQYLTGQPTPEFQIFVDNKPLYSTTQVPATGVTYHTLTFAAPGTYRVKHVYSGNMTVLYFWHLNSTSAAPTDSPYKVAWVGDSWAEKYSGGTNVLDKTPLKTIPWYISMATGQMVYEIGQASTGYWSNVGTSGRTLYNSTVRNNYLVEFAPDLIIIEGTTNDDGQTAAAQGTAAAAYYSALATALPNTALVVMGVQPVNAGTTNRTDRNAAIIAAARAAPNVVDVIDWYGERQAGSTEWLTGTGYRTGETGTGNQDLYVTSDDLHLTAAGRAAMAVPIIRRLAFMRANLAA